MFLFVLLQIKTVISNAFDNYVGPLVGACMVLGAAYSIANNWGRFKEDMRGALIDLGVFALYGLGAGAVLVAIVETYRSLKLY